MLAFLSNYWWIFVLVAIAAIVVVTIILDKKNAKKWLLYAVAAAEQELGSGTGALKLQMVYDSFISKFPFLAHFISFSVFQKLVDDALKSLKELAEGNEKIQELLKMGNEEEPEDKE